MKPIFESSIQQVETGYLFSCRRHNGYEYNIQVDTEGNVTMADYGSINGLCRATPEEEKFDRTVQIAMEGILSENKDEFIKMRDHLNDKFRNIAESIRLEKKSNYDF